MQCTQAKDHEARRGGAGRGGAGRAERRRVAWRGVMVGSELRVAHDRAMALQLVEDMLRCFETGGNVRALAGKCELHVQPGSAAQADTARSMYAARA